MTYVSPSALAIAADLYRRRAIGRRGVSTAGALNVVDARKRTIARRAARAHNSCPVEFVAGTVEPHMAGESYFFTTPSGKTIVRHPGGYKWPTLYHHSTLTVVVGIDWPGLHADVPSGDYWERSAMDGRIVVHGAGAFRALVTTPISAAEIDQAHNEEYRRWLIEQFGGMETYLAGAETVHEDETGRLVRRETAGEPITAVHVTCPSTGREYFLRVPPTTETAREGVAWTFGLTGEQYQPSAQS